MDWKAWKARSLFVLTGGCVGFVAIFILGSIFNLEYTLWKSVVAILVGMATVLLLEYVIQKKPEAGIDDGDEEGEDDIVASDPSSTPKPSPAPAATVVASQSNGDFSKWAIGLAVVALVGVAVSLYFSLNTRSEVGGFQEQLDAKATSAAVSDEVAFLNGLIDGRANQSDLEETNQAVRKLTTKIEELNTRVNNVKGVGDDAYRVAVSAKKLAQTMESRLVQLGVQSVARTESAVGNIQQKLDGHDRLIGRLQTQDHGTGLQIYNLEVRQAHQDSMISAFRAELGLSDRDMVRLAEKIKKGKEKREGEKAEKKRPLKKRAPAIPIQ